MNFLSLIFLLFWNGLLIFGYWIFYICHNVVFFFPLGCYSLSIYNMFYFLWDLLNFIFKVSVECYSYSPLFLYSFVFFIILKVLLCSSLRIPFSQFPLLFYVPLLVGVHQWPCLWSSCFSVCFVFLPTLPSLPYSSSSSFYFLTFIGDFHRGFIGDLLSSNLGWLPVSNNWHWYLMKSFMRVKRACQLDFSTKGLLSWTGEPLDPILFILFSWISPVL